MCIICHPFRCVNSLLTLGAHAQRGLQYLVCVSVALMLVEVEAQKGVVVNESLTIRLTHPETNVFVCARRVGQRISNQLT